MTEQSFDLMAAKLERLKQEMQAQLNADLFRDDGRLSQYSKPLPRRVRWSWTVRRYLVTLWLALKGVELEEPTDWSDY